MAFRKRNIAVGRTPAVDTSGASAKEINVAGRRPSPLSSHIVTSTGTPSLDGLLGGHAGLALGSSLLIEEHGATDFAGALLRYYAAQGICHGHVLHVVGVGEGWVRELPGVVTEKTKEKQPETATNEEKMKIAWRYERLGQAGDRASYERSRPSQTTTPHLVHETSFCHTFDLTKRLSIPAEAKVNHIPTHPTFTFEQVLQSLSRSLSSTPANSCHRLVIPSILSPALYPPSSSHPQSFLAFLRSLKSLLRQHATRLTAMITLPLDLYPRNTGLTCWAEILSDGVLELSPFPHTTRIVSDQSAEKGHSTEEQPQGMLKIHRLPINTERGEGGAGPGNSIGEDLAFTVSRRKFAIRPFSLPPVEGDQEAQNASAELKPKDVEF